MNSSVENKSESYISALVLLVMKNWEQKAAHFNVENLCNMATEVP